VTSTPVSSTFIAFRCQSLEDFQVGVTYDDVTAVLLRAPALKLQLKPSHASVMRDLQEMFVLCNELLPSDVPGHA